MTSCIRLDFLGKSVILCKMCGMRPTSDVTLICLGCSNNLNAAFPEFCAPEDFHIEVVSDEKEYLLEELTFKWS